MKKNIFSRIDSLRKLLSENNLSAFIIPSTDPHLSEYVASHWKSREWISGFTGSAGTVVVTLDKAGLWTDSRYFLQAADQLENSGITFGCLGASLSSAASTAAALSGRVFCK